MPSRVPSRLILALALALMLSACVIESPTVEPSAALPTSTVPLPTVESPVFAPTPEPAPTATPMPTAEPTVEASPGPTTPGDDINALAAQVPSADMAPVVQEPGLVSVPVGGTIAFRLVQPRPILQLPGHSLIYVDADQQAEVDVFTPIATGDETVLADYAAVLDHLKTDPVYADLAELDPVTISGFPARVFEGNPITGARGFYADESTFDNESAGWFPPTRLRLWLIDTDNGPVIFTAESLQDPGQYNDAVRMAAGLLGTITFNE